MANAGKFEGMKREEVQALAKKLGVNAGGKTEEIIARIQTAEAAQGVQEDREQVAGQEQATEKTQGVQEGREQVAGQERATEAAAGRGQVEELVTVKIIEKFLDLKLNQTKEVGETYQVKKERAAELVAAGVAEIQK